DGMSSALSIRALRVGLQNRHGDPKVGQALALFKGEFRQSNMERLLEISKKLREIFGDEVQLLEHFSQDKAMGACEGADGQTLAEIAQGISDDELQQAIKGVLEARQTPKPRQSLSQNYGRLLNLAEEEQFSLLTTIVPVPHDPLQHALYAQAVARPARKLRSYLERLGLAMHQTRARLRGIRL